MQHEQGHAGALTYIPSPSAPEKKLGVSLKMPENGAGLNMVSETNNAREQYSSLGTKVQRYTPNFDVVVLHIG